MSTIRNNLNINAPSQYTNFAYTSMCVFNGAILGSGSTGLHRLNYGDVDLSTDIDSNFTLHLSNFGIENPKKLRRIYLGFESTCNLNVTLVTDKGTTYGPFLVTINPALGQQRVGITIKRIHWFEYATIKVENIDGGFFAMDTIEIFPIIGHNRRK